jgi:hypothetical protein
MQAMANFGTFPGLGARAWSQKSGELAVGLGQTVPLGLWGGGPSDSELDITSADPTVCTVHEKPRPPLANWRSFVVTGLRAGSTKVRACLPGTTSCWAEASVMVTANLRGIRLVFFPGERRRSRLASKKDGRTDVEMGSIYVVGGHGERFDATGGPSVGYQDHGGHTAESTPAGVYTLGPKVRVTTGSWPLSVIPWGATLRLNGDRQVEFSKDGRTWRLATGPRGEVTQAEFAYLAREGKRLPPALVIEHIFEVFVNSTTGTLHSTIWEKNDFGRWGWNLRRNGKPTGFYVHTTPDDEEATAAGRAVFLANSHGCVHVVPVDRDMMIARGYLQPGIDFEVRPYLETGPP